MAKLIYNMVLGLLVCLSQTALANMADDITSRNKAAEEKNLRDIKAKIEAIEKQYSKKETAPAPVSTIPVAGQPAPVPQNYPAPVPGAAPKSIDIFNPKAEESPNKEPAQQNIYR